MGKLVEECTFLDLDVEGDITVSGKVDGVDVSDHAADATIHHMHANKANLDALDQNVGTAGSPAFKGLTVNGDLAVTGKVTGVGFVPANKAYLDTINQNLGLTNIPAFAGLTVNGDIAVNGKVDGVDVSAHGTRHQTGGADALTGSLDANARVQVMVSGKAVGARRTLNLISGNNVTLAVVDNPSNESVDVTISAVGGSGPVAGVETVTGVAGEALNAFDLCYLNADGKYYKTNSLTLATMPAIVLTNSQLNSGQAGNFSRRGLVINTSWAWATVGGYVYAGNTAGALTQIIPSTSTEQLQIVGLATGATQMDFDPQLLLVEVA